MSRRRFLCPVLHAERLHVDEVWRAVERLCRGMERGGSRLTFFVHPFWPMADRADIRWKLKQLAAMGHEIAQHTHYYAETPATVRTIGKHDLLTEENVRRCLDRDFDYLVGAGFRPRGFTSGGFRISDAAFEWLAAHDFAYDCSFRTYKHRRGNPDQAPGDDCLTPFIRNGLLEMPTTGSAKDMVFALGGLRRRQVSLGDLRYELCYIHDYDLVRWPRTPAMVAIDWLFRRPGRATNLTGIDLAERVAAGLAPPSGHVGSTRDGSLARVRRGN